jgi:hypothetical protein
MRNGIELIEGATGNTLFQNNGRGNRVLDAYDDGTGTNDWSQNNFGTTGGSAH